MHLVSATLVCMHRTHTNTHTHTQTQHKSRSYTSRSKSSRNAFSHLALGDVLLANNRNHHGSNVLDVGEGGPLVAVAGEGAHAVTDNAIDEPVDVVALVGLGAVDVLGPERRPRQAELGEILLHLALASLLGLSVEPSPRQHRLAMLA
jgi:hypothetical protein